MVTTTLRGTVPRRAIAVLWATSPRGLSQRALPLLPKLLRLRPPLRVFRRPGPPMSSHPWLPRKQGTAAKPLPSPRTRDKVRVGLNFPVAPETAYHTECNRPERTSWLHSATDAERQTTLSPRKLERQTLPWLPSSRQVCENTPQPPTRRHLVTTRYSHTNANRAKPWLLASSGLGHDNLSIQLRKPS